ncbi:MAG: LysR family transcriptional regulator, partial [Pseudobdellovibrionaceae bacterium]
MVNLYQLTTFVTVISEGSMTAAADKLFLTQPAVSQQIRNLEEDLGVEILVRGVRQIKPTPQGEVLYEYARKILQLVQQTEVALKSIGAELKGHLKIGTLNSIGLHMMSPIVSRLMRHNPDLKIRVEYQRGEDLIKSFKKSAFDILILPEIKTEFETELENVEEKFLLKEEMWLVSSGKDTNVPQRIALKDIPQLSFVNFIDEYPGFTKSLNQHLARLGLNPDPIFESSNVGTLKRVIETGLGWGFLPAHAIKKQVRGGRLTHTHLTDFSYEMNIMLYYKKNSANKMLCQRRKDPTSGQ